MLVDPAAALGTAGGNNRVNSQSSAILSEKGRTAQVINNIVPAGGVLPIPCNGSMFYFLTATLPLQARPSGGVFNPFGQGQGQQFSIENQFQLLEIKNDNSVPVVFSLFIGFDGFIDNTLILNSTNGQASPVYATFPVVNAASYVEITDLSGSPITDLNGNDWYAIRRVAIYISNADSSAVYSLQNLALSQTIALIPPNQVLEFQLSGDFKISEAGPLNLLVSESYQAIPATIT